MSPAAHAVCPCGTEPSAAFEHADRRQRRTFEVGLSLRGVVVARTTVVTLGYSFGFGR